MELEYYVPGNVENEVQMGRIQHLDRFISSKKPKESAEEEDPQRYVVPPLTQHSLAIIVPGYGEVIAGVYAIPTLEIEVIFLGNQPPSQQETVHTLQLEGDITPEWRVVRPIDLSLEIDDDGTFILSDNVFGRYGAGDSVEEAREAYIANLIGFFDIMHQHGDQSNDRDKETIELLQQYVSKIDE